MSGVTFHFTFFEHVSRRLNLFICHWHWRFWGTFYAAAFLQDDAIDVVRFGAGLAGDAVTVISVRVAHLDAFLIWIKTNWLNKDSERELQYGSELWARPIFEWLKIISSSNTGPPFDRQTFEYPTLSPPPFKWVCNWFVWYSNPHYKCHPFLQYTSESVRLPFNSSKH